MQTIDKAISEIKPYSKNPRNNDAAVEPVAASIKEFGFQQPIVIDKDGVIIAGHTRYRAAKMLKMRKVPCVVADQLTEEQINAYRLADNKTGELAKWEDKLLGIELRGIVDIDMGLFSFDIGKKEEKGPVELEEVELTPYRKVHYLVSVDIDQHDLLLPHIGAMREIGGVEIESTLN